MFSLCIIKWGSGRNPLTQEIDQRASYTYTEINWRLETEDRCRELASFLGQEDYFIFNERRAISYQTQSFSEFQANQAAIQEQFRRREQNKVDILNSKPETISIEKFDDGYELLVKRTRATLGFNLRCSCTCGSYIKNLQGELMLIRFQNYRTPSMGLLRAGFMSDWASYPCSEKIINNFEEYFRKIDDARVEMLRTDPQ